MANVLSLKELRTSNVLKAEIKQLEDEKKELLEQLERQKKMEQKLRDDIIEHKKDFDHLEKQFHHFADLEAEYEALQQELQLERLEKLVDEGKQDNKLEGKLKKAREDLAQVQAELKELKKLDPQRLNRQVKDLKKKNLDQAKDNKNLNTALVTERKEVRELTLSKDKLEADLKATRSMSNPFWLSEDENWALFESGLVLKDESTSGEDDTDRILCLNRESGVSVVSAPWNDEDEVTWLGSSEFTTAIPGEAAEEAAKRLRTIAADAEEDQD